jgi:zinc protease
MTLIDTASVARRVLPNGLTVLVRQDRTAPVAAIVTYVNAGYFDETDDVVGIAHVLEHMYFKGTPSRGVGEIARHIRPHALLCGGAGKRLAAGAGDPGRRLSQLGD